VPQNPMEIQAQFFPIVTRLRELEDCAHTRTAKTQVVPGILVHEMALWMPSALANWPGVGNEGCCKKLVMESEYRLHVGQAHEALDDI
jgi:hypothetical protein